MIRVAGRFVIDEKDLEETFMRASGPGGQNVNKVSSAVELRFHLARSHSLPDAVRARLVRLAGRRLTKDGVLVIRADRFRTQEMNRADALQRLSELIEQAAVPPKPRIKTKPTRASKERRLESKERRGAVKRTRREKPAFD